MNPGSLARRYGRAFFLVVEEVGKIDLLGGEIEKVALFFQKNHEVIKTLADNFYPLSERKQLFSQFADHFSLSIETRNFLNLLAGNNMLLNTTQKITHLAAVKPAPTCHIVSYLSPLKWYLIHGCWQ